MSELQITLIPEAAETIVALATAPGGARGAGVGVIRLSGPDALRVGTWLTGKVLSRQKTQTLRRSTIREPENGEVVDEALVAVFHAPRSFTGEDIVEFHAHGGGIVLQRILSLCLRCPDARVRVANPGEFTLRAFLNGKLDLAQAEAIADLVSAETVASQKAAARQLGGALSKAVAEMTFILQEALAHIEAAIDFPEEVGELDTDTMRRLLTTTESHLRALLATGTYGRRLREGLTVVLAGAPNVGKSSLLNAFVGKERAIVTEVAGTTRDIVEDTLQWDGIPIRILDTAGIRDTDDLVEQIGVARSRSAVADADVLFCVLDATRPLRDEERAFLSDVADRHPWILVNKADAAPERAAELAQEFGERAYVVSAVAHSGLQTLAASVVAHMAGDAPASDSVLLTSARHEDSLRRAETALAHARATLDSNLPAELLAVDVHGAMQALGEITGQTARETIIEGIFQRFCIGK